MIKLLFLLIISLWMVSCGGGGGGAAASSQLTNDQVDRIIADLNGKRIENVTGLDSVAN